MFGIGGDDKDKLKENMEEIKQMVNNSAPQSSQQQEDQPPLEEDFSQFARDQQQEKENASPGKIESFSSQADQSRDQGFQGNQERMTESEQPVNQDQSFDERFESQESGSKQPETAQHQENPQRDQQPTQKQQQNSQQPDRDSQQNEVQSSSSKEVQSFDSENRSQPDSQDSSGGSRRSQSSTGSDLNSSIPEPAETKDINVPEIDKGPLFIRRQKFESAKNMIEEMRYIAREIEDVVNQLERGIEEDQQTEQEAKELLHNLEKDRSDVQNIISQQNNDEEG